MTRQSREELSQDIHTYLIVLCVPAIILFLCSIIYFPNNPPKPPSRSSSHERLDFMKGSLELLRNPNSWLIAIVWSIPQVGNLRPIKLVLFVHEGNLEQLVRHDGDEPH